MLHDLSPISTVMIEEGVKYYHFGEIEEVNPDGKCNNKYLTVDINNNACYLSTAVDIARYQLLYGGYHGLKDSLNTMISRLNIFEKYVYNISNIGVFRELLFENKEFISSANKLCTNKHPVLDIYGLKFGIQLPSQQSALHYDAPYFWGASRFLYPLWLLSVMDKSNLYNKYKIKEFQSIMYIHPWKYNKYDGGEFIMYDGGIKYKPKIIAPLSRSLIMMDGTKYLHGTTLVKPYKSLIQLNKDKIYYLKFNKLDNKWDLLQNNISTNISFTDNMLRMAVIIRGRCFKNEQEKINYNPYKEINNISIDTIKNNLVNDMVYNKGYNKKNILNLSPVDFIIKLIDNYIDVPYPLDQTFLPFNYCAIQLLDGFEWTKYILKYICN